MLIKYIEIKIEMKPTEIILHCSATKKNADFSIADIDSWHKQRGFKKVGYHYVIKLDGTIEKGRNEDEIGAHCLQHNAKSIGICYIGGLDKSNKPKDTRTPQQKQSLIALVKNLMSKYDIPINNIHGHYEFANKACPCFKIEEFRKELQ
jgi:N-acetylmuramoyl-L-alanine amidase